MIEQTLIPVEEVGTIAALQPWPSDGPPVLREDSSMWPLSPSQIDPEDDYELDPDEVYTQQHSAPRTAPLPPTIIQPSQSAWDPDWADCGLAPIVRSLYAEKNIKKMYDWQFSCLSNERMLEGRNLIVALPTSAGKTLVAEMITMRCVMVRKKKAIIILPFVSIVVEKVNQLAEFGRRLHFNVEGYYGGQGSFPLSHSTDVAICTIEKGHSLINQMIEEKRFCKEVGLIVIDELHMLDEEERGFNLELLLTKALFEGRNDTIQILGMSATIPNVIKIAQWLQADCYNNLDFRPVPLSEMVKVQNTLYNASGQTIRTVQDYKCKQASELYPLCMEVVSKPDQSVLVFCSSRADTVNTADTLAKCLPPETMKYKEQEKVMLLQKLKYANSGGSDSTLTRTIPMGIAYHNASLTVDEREIIEEGYSNRIINILTCTTTLAAGVNLPARRVILKNLFTGREKLKGRTYRQMCGRAGRAGIDDYGESILISRKDQQKVAYELMNAPLEEVRSSLYNSSCKKCFKRLILDSLGGHYANTRQGIYDFVSCTLYAFQSPMEEIHPEIERNLSYLLDNGFVETFWEDVNGIQVERLRTTLLGNATFQSTFSPEKEASLIDSELRRAQELLVLSDSLHLCYLITPMYNLFPVQDWDLYLSIYNSLPPIRKKIASAVGVTEDYLYNQTVCSKPDSLSDSRHKDNLSLRIAVRFYFALALSDLIEEVPIFQLSKKYKIERGNLQKLQESAQAFGSQMQNFCKVMDYWALAEVISTYCKRINVGTKMELVPLTEIAGVKRARARALWNGGFRTVRQIALATPEELMKAVRAGPYAGEGISKMIIRSAKELLEKKARELREQAEELLPTGGTQEGAGNGFL
ncbi:hypothetical protein PROFUN_03419 [Planoprotostelium fungivorum]|uniref:DNA polymerase theta n=1 Tax=Planoprotostelium fungivorum TaxID=1890364 RepID=A0A2P6NWH5_9EUKA|nr:hypothetical protein PROFUN_03419 [Planoprotostelium fungivorum]